MMLKTCKDQENNFPGLIIGGAPKCGTSSLFNWLNDHPEMIGSQPKETFFLMDRHNPLINEEHNFFKDGIKGYNYFFPQNFKDKGIKFEATTHYIYQDSILKAISEQNIEPKIIFLLRKPSTRIYSSFEFSKNTLAAFKKSISFSEYTNILLSGEIQKLNEYVSRKKSLFVLKNDLHYSTYILFLKKWKNELGEKNIKVLLFENLILSPREILCDIAKDLGIDSDFYYQYSFYKKNETYGVKSKRIHKVIRSVSSKIPAGKIKILIKNIYLILQQKKIHKSNSDQEALKKLDNYFKPYNKELAESFNINLDVWQY